MKKFIFAFVLMLGVIFLITSFAEVQDIVDTLSMGKWYYLFISLISLVIWFLICSKTYQLIYRELGMQQTLRNIFVLFSSAYFTNTVTPTAGFSSIAVFLTDAHRKGFSSAKVTVAWAIYLLLDYFGLLAAISLGIIVLVRRNDLNWTEISAALILCLLAGTLISLLYLGLKSARQLGAALAYLARITNRIARVFSKKEFLNVEQTRQFAYELADGIQIIRQNPKNLLVPILLSILGKAVLLLIFTFTFLMFDVPFSKGTIVAGFAICYLFTVVSPTPAGVGVVEGILPLALTGLHVKLGAATIITLAYRGISFWLPLLIGMITFKIFSEQASQAETGETHP